MSKLMSKLLGCWHICINFTRILKSLGTWRQSVNLIRIKTCEILENALEKGLSLNEKI